MNPTTAIQANPPAANAPPPPGQAGAPIPSLKKDRGLLYKTLEFCASLRITVVLFLLSFILVFYGTWAQVDSGTWTAVKEYFRSPVVMIPLKIVFLRAFDIPGSIPFPGGWLLGGLLLINLLAAHAIRFKISWKRSGILLIHAGIILMMLGELFTGLFAIESRLTVTVGNTVNYTEEDRLKELAISDRSDPKVENEVVIPASLLAKGGLIQHPELPFDVEVVRYYPNSDLRNPKESENNPATTGVGLTKLAVAKGETAGVDSEQAVEIASVYVTIKEKGSRKSLGTYLVSSWHSFFLRPPEEVSVDGKKYALNLRGKRAYRPFSVFLKDFNTNFHEGTNKPKSYESFIRLTNPETGEDLDVKIYMNHPLRYGGETFYQSGVYGLGRGTILQVVRNPSWLLPYFSCGLVTLGMLVHFGLHLTEFLRRRIA